MSERAPTALAWSGPATRDGVDPAPVAGRTDGADGVARAARVAREYGLLSAAVAAVVAVMVRPWSAGWATPIVSGSDALSHFAMLRDAGWTGTARGPEGLAVAGGLDWSDFPLGPDRAHLVLYRSLKLLVGDPMVALNLYLLLGFLLVAWAAYAVLRVWRISPLVAGAVSIAFTLAPYHFARLNDGHVFLAAYFAVPLGALLAVWASDGSLARGASRVHRAVAVACVVVVGSSSAYYAVFSVVLIVSLGITLAVRRGSWRAIVAPAVVAAGIVGVLGANVAGDLWSARSAGVNHEVSVRPTSDSDTYGLRLAQVLLPMPEHRIEPFAELGRQARQVVQPGESGAAIGLLAFAGLLAVAATCVRTAGRARDDSDRLVLRLGVMAAGAVLVGTVSGLGLVVAVAGFGQIRVWSRMAIVLAFLGLAGLAVVVDRWCRGERVRSWSFGPLLVAVGIVAIAMLDQTSPGSLPDPEVTAAQRAVDERVAAELEQALPEGATVLQLPQTDFLFAIPQGDLPLYGLLGPWSTGTDLGWSAGTLQGRGGDWQRSWATQPPEVLVAGASAAGFDALYLDRRSEAGDDEGTAATAAWWRAQRGDPDGIVVGGPTSAEGQDDAGRDRREWFDLRPVRTELVERLGESRVRSLGDAVRRPVGVVYEGAVDRFAVPDGARLLHADAALVLRDESAAEAAVTTSDRPGALIVRFELQGAEGASVRITGDGVDRTVSLGDGPTPVELEVPVSGRDTRLQLRTDGSRLAGAAARHGDVRLQISQVQVVDADLDGAIARGELRLD